MCGVDRMFTPVDFAKGAEDRADTDAGPRLLPCADRQTFHVAVEEVDTRPEVRRGEPPDAACDGLIQGGPVHPQLGQGVLADLGDEHLHQDLLPDNVQLLDDLGHGLEVWIRGCDDEGVGSFVGRHLDGPGGVSGPPDLQAGHGGRHGLCDLLGRRILEVDDVDVAAAGRPGDIHLADQVGHRGQIIGTADGHERVGPQVGKDPRVSIQRQRQGACPGPRSGRS